MSKKESLMTVFSICQTLLSIFSKLIGKDWADLEERFSKNDLRIPKFIEYPFTDINFDLSLFFWARQTMGKPDAESTVSN